jgi:hypothetical protein
MKKLAALCCLTACVCTSSFATQSTVFGAPDCGTWVQNQSFLYRAWLLGFMSGKNNIWMGTPADPLQSIQSGQQIILWMDNYCRAHPLDNVVDGANALWHELVNRK